MNNIHHHPDNPGGFLFLGFNIMTSKPYDLFDDSRRELSLEMERSERRRRLYKKFGADKKKSLSQNTWSVEDHRDFLMCGYWDGQLEWRVIQRKMIVSPAFWSLSGTETKVLLMCCNEVDWKKTKKRTVKVKGPNGKRRKIELPREPKDFSIPINRLEAVGISRSSAIRAMDRLQRLGFIKKIAAPAGLPTIYELSEEYQWLSSQEIGGVKNTPHPEREKPFSGNTQHRKTFIRAIK